MSIENLMKEEKKMTTASHGGDSEESHKIVREGAKANGKQKRVSE